MGYNIPKCLEISHSIKLAKTQTSRLQSENLATWLHEALVERRQFDQLKVGEFLLSDPYDREILFRAALSQKIRASNLIGRFNEYGTAVAGAYIVDRQGNKLNKEPLPGFAREFHEGFAVINTKDKKFNYVRRDGTFLRKEGVAEAKPFSEGLGLVKNSKGRWFYIDTEGKVVKKGFFKDGFAEALPFENGEACVKRESGGSYQFLDKNGDISGTRIPLNRLANPHDGYLLNKDVDEDGDETYYFMDPITGEVAHLVGLFDAHDFREGRAWVSMLGGSSWECIDTDRKTLFRGEFDEINDFSEGFALVNDFEKSYYINKEGKNIFGLVFPGKEITYVSNFQNGVAKIFANDGIMKVIDRKGRTVFERKYDNEL